MYQKILVPLDGSPLAEQAIPYATELCKGSTEVTLFQVVHLPLPLAAPDVGMSTPIPDSEARLKEAREYLQAIAARLRQDGVRVKTEVIERDVVADAIVAHATEHQCDLIAMTTHGRSGLSRLLFGSVAESVVRHAPCPVLLIRSHASQS